jgi:F-type H+-transporting ATPase subunit gamma
VPSLRDIRRRIGSIKSTRQVTRAMKMVAAAKLRRAQEAILKARPYVTLLEQSLANAAAHCDSESILSHPLLSGRPAKNAEIVVVTSDRGQAGAFNSNVLRRARGFFAERRDSYDRIDVSTVGRKARDAFRSRKTPIRKDYADIQRSLRFEHAREIAEELAQRFLSGEVDEVFLCFSEFKNAASHNVVIRRLIPFESAPPASSAQSGIDFLYEPSRETLFGELLPRHLQMQVWRCLLESAASEHGARMAAMDSATRNAEKVIGKLTLQFNKARQAYITRELMEIVGGAEALK